MKLLVVGTGSIGKRHLGNFQKYFNECDIVDSRQDRIDECNEKFKVRNSYLSYDEAFEKNEYDLALITLPPHLHLDVAKKAANKNINLFIEKPLGLNSKGWNEIAEICKKKNLINYVAYCHRHINYTKNFKEILDSNKFGRILNVSMKWGSYLPDWHPWEDYRSFYMAKKELGGGALLDESHGIDLIRYFFGEVKEVFAIVDKTSELEINSDDHALLTLRMKNNSLIQINFDLVARAPSCKMEVTAENGTLIWDRVNHKIQTYDAESKEWNEQSYTKQDFLDMYTNQTKYFVDCLKQVKQTMIDINDSIKTQDIIDKSFLSAQEKKLIKL
jgi:predicted dehydrogenase